MINLILASASPRRHDLLKSAGFEFVVIPSNVSEKIDENLTPEQIVMDLAHRKARAVDKDLASGSKAGKVILAADTLVFLNGKILEKPKNPEEAFTMLRSLSGQTHMVRTGICLIDAEDQTMIQDCETTEVQFRELTDDEILGYVATGEPMDKAGAYGVQGLGGAFIHAIFGNKDSVMGLPVQLFEKRWIELQFQRLMKKVKQQRTTLIAVTKLQPVWKIRWLYSLGQRDFAENYVQEFLRKKQELADLKEIRWHFIGHVQSKKIGQLLGQVDFLHSVDSLELLRKWNSRLTERLRAENTGGVGKAAQKLQYFLQVNLAKEESKTGFFPEQLKGLMTELQSFSQCTLVGLMALPPQAEEGPTGVEMAKKYFEQLRDLQGVVRREIPSCRYLSMGTSLDYEAALSCGSTHLRIGESLLGPRPIETAGNSEPAGSKDTFMNHNENERHSKNES